MCFCDSLDHYITYCTLRYRLAQFWSEYCYKDFSWQLVFKSPLVCCGTHAKVWYVWRGFLGFPDYAKLVSRLSNEMLMSLGPPDRPIGYKSAVRWIVFPMPFGHLSLLLVFPFNVRWLPFCVLNLISDSRFLFYSSLIRIYNDLDISFIHSLNFNYHLSYFNRNP